MKENKQQKCRWRWVFDISQMLPPPYYVIYENQENEKGDFKLFAHYYTRIPDSYWKYCSNITGEEINSAALELRGARKHYTNSLYVTAPRKKPNMRDFIENTLIKDFDALSCYNEHAFEIINRHGYMLYSEIRMRGEELTNEFMRYCIAVIADPTGEVLDIMIPAAGLFTQPQRDYHLPSRAGGERPGGPREEARN